MSPRPAISCRGPYFCKGMLRTVVFIRLAYVTAIKDETVVDVFPVFLGNEHFEILRDFLQIRVVGEIEFTREALHVRIRGNTWPFFEQLPDDDMCRLIADSRQFLELRDVSRHFSFILTFDELCGENDVLRFSAEE